MTSIRGLALSLLVLAGCSSSGDKSKPLPSAAEMEAFVRVSNVFVIPVDVDGTTGVLGVDTGDPFLLLNPATFPSAPTVGTSNLTIAGTKYPNVPVISSSQSPTSPDPAVPLGGLVGCPILCNNVVNFNYRDVAFTIGSTPSVSDLLPETVMPFAFEGGGAVVQLSGQNVTIPESRVVVDVDIEGTSYRMIVDTGASEVAIDQAAYDALTADGRVKLTSSGVETTAGQSSASYTRAKTITMGGVSATGVVVLHDTSFDTNLAALTTDTGETIHGSLGGTFLEHFNLTIDYPNRELHLAPYSDVSFIVDPAELPGFSLGTAVSTGYSVSAVFSGSDAATKGVAAGDIVTAIDGQDIASLSISQVGVLSSGAVGSTKSVQFGAAKTLANQTVDIKVEELLPLPK